MSLTNEILRNNANGVYAGLRIVKPEDGDRPQQYVLIEGDAEAFRFLGSLFTAMADPAEDCSLTIHPQCAGLAHFVQGSDLGFMLHRNDCAHGSKR